MTSTKLMESLASKAFNQVADKMYRERSCLYWEKEHKLYDFYNEIERLFKRTICVGKAEFERLVIVFILSIHLSDELNKLDGVL